MVYKGNYRLYILALFQTDQQQGLPHFCSQQKQWQDTWVFFFYLVVFQVIQNMKAAPEDERFNRLKKLLDRSNVYAQFLLRRMDQQRENEKARRETKEKAKEKRDAEMVKSKEDNQVGGGYSAKVSNHLFI